MKRHTSYYGCISLPCCLHLSTEGFAVFGSTTRCRCRSRMSPSTYESYITIHCSRNRMVGQDGVGDYQLKSKVPCIQQLSWVDVIWIVHQIRSLNLVPAPYMRYTFWAHTILYECCIYIYPSTVLLNALASLAHREVVLYSLYGISISSTYPTPLVINLEAAQFQCCPFQVCKWNDLWIMQGTVRQFPPDPNDHL